MFPDKKNKTTTTSTVQRTPERNVLGKNTTFIGDIISEGDFRIDGTVEGSIKTSGRIIIGKDGKVKGNTTCNNADIEGSIVGQLTVSSLLTLKSTANIQGEVIMDKLSVEPGAVFNATCSMKGAKGKDSSQFSKQSTGFTSGTSTQSSSSSQNGKKDENQFGSQKSEKTKTY
jgi:cytoskeletal protein CcmA (bactofilin family)